MVLGKKNPIFIGFGHKSRVGKDTVSNMLHKFLTVRHPRFKVERFSFARLLKKTCHDLFSWARLQKPEFYEKKINEHLRDIKLDAIGLTPVETWIEVGNKLREVCPDIWIRAGLSKLIDADIVICSDVRYFNEIRIPRKLYKSLFFKVTNSRAPLRDSVSDNALNDFDDWDAQINNEGSKYELKHTVEKFILPIVENMYV